MNNVSERISTLVEDKIGESQASTRQGLGPEREVAPRSRCSDGMEVRSRPGSPMLGAGGLLGANGNRLVGLPSSRRLKVNSLLPAVNNWQASRALKCDWTNLSAWRAETLKATATMDQDSEVRAVVKEGEDSLEDFGEWASAFFIYMNFCALHKPEILNNLARHAGFIAGFRSANPAG